MTRRPSILVRASAFAVGTTASLSLLLASACGPAETEPEPRTVELRFDAIAKGAPLRCGGVVDGLGRDNARYELKDLRFYVHDVRLVAEDGTEHAMALESDGVWQSEELALLDFEDRSGECANGTVELRDRVVGKVPDGVTFKEVRFRMGVPESLNHGDASVAKAPLNLTSLFWSWRAGYKFIRLDGRTEGLPTGHNLHLGSTGCSEAPTTCTESNRPDVSLPGFELEKSVITLDVSALFATSDLNSNAAGTPPGCMGAPSADADCSPMFERFGLTGGTQSAFVLKDRAP